MNNPAEMKQALQFDGKPNIRYLDLKAIEFAKAGSDKYVHQRTDTTHRLVSRISIFVPSIRGNDGPSTP